MMIDTILLRCGDCGKVQHYTIPFIKGMMRTVRQNKYEEVVKQMQEKSGPFYDKWLAAMEKRGPQMRCKWCSGLHDITYNPRYLSGSCYERGHRGGHFACPLYQERSGD